MSCYKIQVNVSELGLVTPAGKVVWGKRCFTMMLHFPDSFALQILMIHFNILLDGWMPGKYAQVTNNPENDGCINAVLLV